jgi:hypothetical protein
MDTKKLFYVNSRNRTNGTDSDFTYNFDFGNLQPTHVVLLQCNIPKSYYVVRSGQNTFTLTEENTDSVVISITPGNYNRTTFKQTVNSLLTSNSPNGYTYTITVPSGIGGDSGKYTYTCVGHTLQTKFITASDNNIFELLGFDEGSTNTFVAGSLTSTNVTKLTKEDTIFIHSDLVGGHNNNVLQEIYSVENSDYSNIVFQNFATDFYEKQIISNGSNNYRFQLQNEDGEHIDINGLNWNMTLCFYLKDNTSDMFRQYMKYNMSLP